jgi:hypothetical protein
MQNREVKFVGYVYSSGNVWEQYTEGKNCDK